MPAINSAIQSARERRRHNPTGQSKARVRRLAPRSLPPRKASDPESAALATPVTTDTPTETVLPPTVCTVEGERVQVEFLGAPAQVKVTVPLEPTTGTKLSEKAAV